jgi:hypothetical protein
LQISTGWLWQIWILDGEIAFGTCWLLVRLFVRLLDISAVVLRIESSSSFLKVVVTFEWQIDKLEDSWKSIHKDLPAFDSEAEWPKAVDDLENIQSTINQLPLHQNLFPTQSISLTIRISRPNHLP